MTTPVLANVPGSPRITITDLSGDPIDPDEAVLVTVYDGADVEFAAETAASAVLDDELDPITGTFTTTFVPTLLDRYRLHWTTTIAAQAAAFDTYVDAVGGFHFSIAALRNSDPAFTTGDEAARYTGELLLEARTDVESRMEAPDACNVALVPRGRRADVGGDGTRLLILPDVEIREIYSITHDGETLDVDDLHVERWGGVWIGDGSTWTRGFRNVSVHYAHGLDLPPAALRRASLMAAREYLLPSGIPARATLQSTDLGTFRISSAGPDRPFGIPEVDNAIHAFNRRRPAVG